MANRDAIVLDAWPGRLRLQALGSTCRDCSSGCGGRCHLFASSEAIEFDLAASDHPAVIGEQVIVHIDDAALRHAAWLGYGRCLMGLLLGAVLGHLVGLSLGRAENLLTFMGLAAGTFLALVFSKRKILPLRLLPARTACEMSLSNPSTIVTECKHP